MRLYSGVASRVASRRCDSTLTALLRRPRWGGPSQLERRPGDRREDVVVVDRVDEDRQAKTASQVLEEAHDQPVHEGQGNAHQPRRDATIMPYSERKRLDRTGSKEGIQSK